MTDRSGRELAKAVADGDELTEVERLRVVLAMKTQQISRLASRIGFGIVAAQTGEHESVLVGILRGELVYDGDQVVPAKGKA